MLEPELDVYDFYSERISVKFAVAELKKGIEPHTESVSEGITTIAKAISKKPILIRSMEGKNDAPWIDNPNGTAANYLYRCSENLTTNRLSAATEILDGLEKKKESFTENELAEYYFQHGRLSSLKGDYYAAEKHYALALEKDDKDRYRLGHIESRFKLDNLPNKQFLEDFLRSLSNDSYQKCFIKAKCLVLLDRKQEAELLLSQNYPEKIVGMMTVFTMTGNFQEIDDLTEKYRGEEFEHKRDSFVFSTISARRLFYRATEGKISIGEELPTQGKPTYDLELMKQAFYHSKRAWVFAKELGYPDDIMILLDISVLVYGYFGSLDQLTEYFEEMLVERPDHPELIRIYSRLLFDRGEFHRIIELLNRLPSLEPDDCGQLILSHYYLGKANRVLELIREYESILLSKPDRNSAMIFCVGSELANELFDKPLSRKYEDIVNSLGEGEALLALRKFITSCNHDPDRKREFEKELYQRYLDLDKPIVIAEQLFRNLDPELVESAQLIIEMGEHLLSVRELLNPDYIHLGKAFLSTGRWSDAETIADRNIRKGIDIARWSLFRAAALHHQGKIGSAYSAISDVVTSPNATKDQNIFYINLCLSLGLFDNIVSVVQDLLAESTVRTEKLNLVKILISIFYTDENRSDDLMRAIERFGELVDQDSCEEEGSYLQLFLLSSGELRDESRIEEFRERLSRYTEAFPDSSFLKMGTINSGDGPDGILDSINKMAGITERQRTQWEKNKISIRNGSLPVPFSMLNLFLSDTGDVFTSWANSLRLSDQHLEYKIRHAPQLAKYKFESILDSGATILLDITSILSLNHINLLDEFIASVERFSIIDKVFEKINKCSHPISGSPYSVIPKKIMRSLQNDLEKLELVKVKEASDVEECAEAVGSVSGIFLLEDMNLRACLGLPGSNVETANIFNIVEMLRDKGYLSQEEFFEKIVAVFEMGLFEPNMRLDLLHGVFAYFFSSGEEIEYSDTRFALIFDKLFDFKRKSEFCLNLLFRMLNGPASEFEINPATLLSIFKGFLIRHPIIELPALNAHWLIFRCIQEEPDYSSLTGRSEKHYSFWHEYEQLMARCSDEGLSFDLMVRNIVRGLFEIKEQARDEAYVAIKSSFIPMTEEADNFEKIYQELALEYRLQRR